MKPNSSSTLSPAAKSILDPSHLSMPEGLHLESDSSSLRMSYSQFKPIIWLALIFGVFFSGGGVYLFASDAPGFIYTTSFLMGLFFVYSSLVGICNHRTIVVTRDQLNITYDPLPFEKKHVLDSNKLSQLYTHITAIPSRYRDITGFTLEAILCDGSLMPLLSDPSYEKVHYLEVQIESWLGIEDLTVEGEVKLH